LRTTGYEWWVRIGLPPAVTMPPFYYWFSGAALFLAGSFTLSTATGLIGIKQMISNKIARGLMCVALILLALGWWSAAKQEQSNAELAESIKKLVAVAQGEEELSTVITALRDAQHRVAGYEQADAIIRRILAQYEQLRAATEMFEKMGNPNAAKDRLAAAERIMGDLRAELGNIQFRQVSQGQALIIKTAPNTFRVTFPVPMRAVPSITFSQLPPGVTAKIIEKSNVGFTVVFEPLTIPIDHLP
jgi:hypothetical protein